MSENKRRPEDDLDGESPAGKRVKIEQNGASNGTDALKSAENDVGDEAPAPKQEEEEDEDFIVLPQSTTRSALKKGHECPYLDTILRQVSVRALGLWVAEIHSNLTAYRGCKHLLQLTDAWILVTTLLSLGYTCLSIAG